MDISKLKPVKISAFARDKIVNEFFPDIEDQFFEDKEFSNRELEMHAGAFALYVTTLITRAHEVATEEINFEATDRKTKLIEAIKNHPRFANLSDEEISTMAHNMILKDIRNSFAHGNFKISYDIYTKKLFFVLEPRRKDFVVDSPIVISKDELINVNKNIIDKLHRKWKINGINDINLINMMSYNLDDLTKEYMLPIQFIKLVEHYLDNKRKVSPKLTIPLSRYTLLNYYMLATKITYEQDDFYKLLGKDSHMFERITFIRNSVAHDGVGFEKLTEDVKNVDRDKVETYNLKDLMISLLMAVNMKDTLIRAEELGYNKEDMEDLSTKLKLFFDGLYIDEHELEKLLEDMKNNIED